MNRYENNYFKVFFDNYSAQERGWLICESIKRNMRQDCLWKRWMGISDGRTRDF